VPAPHYRLGNGRGEIVHDFDMSSLLKSFGPIQGIPRAELLDILRGGSATLRFTLARRLRPLRIASTPLE
jgi:hypothetical protein